MKWFNVLVVFGLHVFSFETASAQLTTRSLPENPFQIIFEWTYYATEQKSSYYEGYTEPYRFVSKVTSSDPAKLSYSLRDQPSVKTTLINQELYPRYSSDQPFSDYYRVFYRSIRNTDAFGNLAIKNGLKNKQEKCMKEALGMYQELVDSQTIQNILFKLQSGTGKKVNLVLEFVDDHFTYNYFALHIEMDGVKIPGPIITNKTSSILNADFYKQLSQGKSLQACWSFKINQTDWERKISEQVMELETKQSTDR